MSTELICNVFNIEIELNSAIANLENAFRLSDSLSIVVDDVESIRKTYRLYHSPEHLNCLNKILNDMHFSYSAEGFFTKVKDFFVMIWNAIKRFFKWIRNKIASLFGKGSKLPNTPAMKELAKDNPELEKLIDSKLTSDRMVGLTPIREFLLIMSGKNRPVKAAEAVNITDIDGLLGIVGGVTEAFSTYCTNEAKSMAESIGNEAMTDAKMEEVRKRFESAFLSVTQNVKPPEVKAAIATGKTDMLQDLFTKKYVKQTVNPKEVITYIEKSTQLSKSLTESINKINNGMSEVQRDVIEKYGKGQDGDENANKVDAIGRIIQMGCGYMRRFLGIEQCIYTFIAKYELEMAQSLPKLEDWFASTKKLNKDIEKKNQKAEESEND